MAPRLKRIEALIDNIDKDAAAVADQHQIERLETLGADVHISRAETRLQHAEARANQARILERLDSFSSHPVTLLSSFHEGLPIPNPAFFGREDELRQLTTYLTPGANTRPSPVCVALYGLAGCGKTQLAVQFVHSHLDTYDAILWVAAEEKHQIEDSFRKIAQGLNLVDGSVAHSDKVKNQVKQWLGSPVRKGLLSPTTHRCQIMTIELIPREEQERVTPLRPETGFLSLTMLRT